MFARRFLLFSVVALLSLLKKRKGRKGKKKEEDEEAKTLPTHFLSSFSQPACVCVSKINGNKGRSRTITETKLTSSNLKSALKHAKKVHRLSPKLDGLSSMLRALKILRVASKARNSDITERYKILQVEPFSHMNTIKKQYKKVALVLHADKNPFLGCEESLKLVAEGFRVLYGKIWKKEYDLRLRIRLQDERVSDNSAVETFWPACSRCRLWHQFERVFGA